MRLGWAYCTDSLVPPSAVAGTAESEARWGDACKGSCIHSDTEPPGTAAQVSLYESSSDYLPQEH